MAVSQFDVYSRTASAVATGSSAISARKARAAWPHWASPDRRRWSASAAPLAKPFRVSKIPRPWPASAGMSITRTDWPARARLPDSAILSARLSSPVLKTACARSQPRGHLHPGGAALAGAIAQHVRHGVDGSGVGLADLVEQVERVAGPATVVSAALSVVRQLPSAHPQVERAACRTEVLPIDEPPRKWKPPNSCPVRCSSGPAKLAARAKTRRLLPTAGAATCRFQSPRLPRARTSPAGWPAG